MQQAVIIHALKTTKKQKQKKNKTRRPNCIYLEREKVIDMRPNMKLEIDWTARDQ